MRKRDAAPIGLVIALLAPSALVGADREIHRTFQLPPGAVVQVSGVNGHVEIITAEGREAVVTIKRRAPSEGDFQSRPVMLEQKGKRLVLRIENRGAYRLVNDEVSLRIPSNVSLLEITGVNGRVESGFIEGRFRVDGVNGPVSLVQASGKLDMPSIDGAVDVEMGAPRGSGVQMKGINGSIHLRLPRGASFDIEARNKNGAVKIELPGVDIDVNERYHFRARVGGGGPDIHLDGINGTIRISE